MKKGIKLKPGDVYGNFTVIEYTGVSRSGKRGNCYEVTCVCGKELILQASVIARHTTVSCGCQRKKPGEHVNVYHVYDGHIEIEISNGKRAIVDFDDFDDTKQYKWYPTGHTAVARIEGKLTTMGNFLVGGGPFVYKNRNSLDNRKENLIPSTISGQRAHNQAHFQCECDSRGVHMMRNKYAARVAANGVNYYLGTFDTEEEAAAAYDKKAAMLHGRFANLNSANKE